MSVDARWLADTTLTPLGDGRFAATLPEHWTSLQGVHGGFVAALAVRAADAAVATLDDGASAPPTAARTLRAATFGFVRGSTVGPCELRSSIVRAGTALVATEVQVLQDDRVAVVARCHHSPAWEGVAYSDLPAPMPRPHDAARFDSNGRVRHFTNAETWMDPSLLPFQSGPTSQWRAWTRPQNDGAATDVDAAWLTMLGDYYPPAVFARLAGPARAVTIEYAVQIHVSELPVALDTGAYVHAHLHATHSAEGFAIEDGVLHAPDGRILATMRQSRLAG